MFTREELMQPRPGRKAATEIRLVRKAFEDFDNETDPTRKRGYAAILQGHIDLYLEESEPRPGKLAEGRCDDSKLRMPADRFANGEVKMTEAYPFDAPGECKGLGFYCAQPGHFSPVFRGPPYDKMVPALTSYLYFVYGMEKRYATEEPTTHHLTEGGILSELGEAMDAPRWLAGDERHLVLCDPAGHAVPEGLDSLTAIVTNDLEAARPAADELAKLLSIRFVVATQRMCLNTR